MSEVTEITFTDQGRDTSDPARSGAQAGQSGSSSNDCENTSANVADRVVDARIARQRHQVELLEAEETKAFISLEKNLKTMDDIVLNARNIHKTIREALEGAMLYLGHVKDCREGLVTARSVLARETERVSVEAGASTEGRGALQGQVRDQATQTGRVFIDQQVAADRNDASIPAARPDKKEEGKKRGASTSPEVTQERKKRGGQTEERNVEETQRPSKNSGVREDGQDWSKVVRRKERPKKTDGGNRRKTKRTHVRRPDAILVKAKPELSYADIIRKLKEKVSPGDLGVEISGMRRTRGGELLVEVKNDSGKLEDLREAVAGALADEASVRKMVPRITMEIRDMDEATSENDILEAIETVVEGTDFDTIKVRALRSGFGRTQWAVVTMPSTTADQLLKTGRLKIGWMRCRVRERIEVVRCFRCLGFGHVAVDCKGKDRSKLCRLCGKEDHKSKECKAQPFCLVCNDAKDPGGARHILGSAKCASFQKELNKAKK